MGFKPECFGVAYTLKDIPSALICFSLVLFYMCKLLDCLGAFHSHKLSLDALNNFPQPQPVLGDILITLPVVPIQLLAYEGHPQKRLVPRLYREVT